MVPFARSAVVRRNLALRVLAFLTLASCSPKPSRPELRIMTWTDYLRDEEIKSFEAKTGSKVIRDYFSSNEELLAKVRASVESGGRGYDLILPSDYMVTSFMRLNLLRPLEKSRLTFLSNFDPAFLHPAYDPNLDYAVPFAYGVTGFAVNTKLLPKFDEAKGLSWKTFFEDPAYKGKVVLLNDVREVAQAALFAMGKTSWSEAKPDDIQKAFDYLRAHKGQLKVIAEEVRPVIEAGECTVCQAFSGDVHQIAVTKPEVKFIVPTEGGTVWTDNFAIPTNARNADLAYAFMNNMLSPDAAATFTRATFYATPIAAAKAKLDPSVVSATAIYPDATLHKRLKYMSERADILKLVDRLWTELKVL